MHQTLIPDSRTALPVERVLRPKAIAVIGVSSQQRSFGGFVIENLQRFGYGGEIHLVSRSSDEFRGQRCLKSVEGLPPNVDVAILVVPEAAVLDTVASCGERKIGAAVVFASGFAETGAAGRDRQEKLTAIAHRAGILLAGPNCMGLTNYVDGIPLTFEPIEPIAPGVARDADGVGVVSQSGAMANNIRDALRARGLALTYCISTGNEAMLGIEDYLAYLIADADTRVIVMYAEQIRHPRLFLDLANCAREAGKPIVLMLPGSSGRARHSAQSHTGALAGDHAVACVLLKAHGVAVVDSPDELFDTAAILARFPTPSAAGPALMTNSGALKTFALDFSEAIGLDLPALSPATRTRLEELLPSYAVAENPLDYTTIGARDPGVVGSSAEALLGDANVGGLIASVMGGPPSAQRDKAEHLLPALARATKPAALVIMGDDDALSEEFSGAIRASRVPFFRSPDRAMRAMRQVLAYGKAIARTGRTDANAPALCSAPPRSGVLAEYQGKAWLAAAGMNVPAGALAQDVAGACRIAARIGYPIVLKAQASALPHKSDVGGVIVGLADERALRDGFERLFANVRAARPGLELEGVLVERVAPKGLELVVGAKRDPDWGPVVMVGLGGVWIEALKDVRLMPADIPESQIVEEILRLKGAALLRGLRGTPAIDVRAVARAVSLLGRLMRGTPSVAEIDINPLIAYPDGVLALDALVICDPVDCAGA